jgi:hypothetical protein
MRYHCHFLNMQSIIIIGTQRSGSNLLRLMLNQHSQIAAPHPPHIMQTFMPLLPKYGDLNNSANFLQLATDVCSFVMNNPVQWGVSFDANVVVAKAKSHTLIGIYQVIYETYAAALKKVIWCSKSMTNLYFIPQIEAAGVHPYYIHLVRDGRDVAASFRKTIVGEKHCYHIAKQWKTDQDVAEKNCHQFAADRYIPVMYENLIRDPENTLRILLQRMKLEYEATMLEYHQATEAQKTAEAGKMWENVRKPVMVTNSNKFLKQLSEEDVLIFESVAGDVLERHGYTPYFSREKWIKHFSNEQIAEFTKANEVMKAEATRNFDPEGVRKREPQDSLVKNIKNRS